jgi:hypothetical protein
MLNQELKRHNFLSSTCKIMKYMVIIDYKSTGRNSSDLNRKICSKALLAILSDNYLKRAQFNAVVVKQEELVVTIF